VLNNSVADSAGLSLFVWPLLPPKHANYNAKFRENLNLQQFKVIQGRWFWYQSKAHIPSSY